MSLEQFDQPFIRLEDPKFLALVRETFSTLLQDRATDPDKTGQANESLYEFGQNILEGKKIPRTPATESIFRGVFVELQNKYPVSQYEIDSLEKKFFL